MNRNNCYFASVGTALALLISACQTSTIMQSDKPADTLTAPPFPGTYVPIPAKAVLIKKHHTANRNRRADQ